MGGLQLICSKNQHQTTIDFFPSQVRVGHASSVPASASPLPALGWWLCVRDHSRVQERNPVFSEDPLWLSGFLLMLVPHFYSFVLSLPYKRGLTWMLCLEFSASFPVALYRAELGCLLVHFTFILDRMIIPNHSFLNLGSRNCLLPISVFLHLFKPAPDSAWWCVTSFL